MNKNIAIINQNLIKTRRKLLSEFAKFRQYYFPHYNKLPDSIFHKDMSYMLNNISIKRSGRLAIAAPRGSAKSTLVTVQYVIFCICHNIEKFIVIISNTSDQAQGYLSDIKRELESNERLCKDFPEVCEIDRKPAPQRWSQKEILTKNGVKVSALGAGQQIRGRKNKEYRPGLIILDDIEKDDSIQNPESYYKLQDWLEKSVLKSGTSDTNIIFVGTIHHYESLLAKFTSPDKYFGWKKKIYRSIISWAENTELWEEWHNIYSNKTEFNGESGINAAEMFFTENQTEMLKGTKVLWPEAKDYYSLIVQREEEGYLSFDSEMQNEPVNPRDCIFNMDDVHYWDDRFGSDEELIAHLKENGRLQMIAACDPSLGKQNKNSDYSAIICAAYDSKNRICYILDADLDKRPPDKLISAIIALHRRRNFDSFGFESNGFQSCLGDTIVNQAEAEGYYLNMQKITNNTDKRSRIESLQPMIKNGAIQFSKKHRLLLEQLKLYPKSRHDDGLDALQMVYSFCKKEDPVIRFEKFTEGLDRVMRGIVAERYYTHSLF